MYKVRNSTFDDVLYLKDRLRKSDVEELKLLNSTPFLSLSNSYYFSEQCYTVTLNDNPVAMFGAGRINFNTDKKTASVWFMSSDEIELYKLDFLKQTKTYFEKFKNDYDILINVVDIKNHKYKKWLKRLGFKFGRPFEVSGGQLVPFSITPGEL